METEVFNVKNMNSQEDADKILASIEHVWGLSKAEVSLLKKEATVTFDERMASTQDFVQAIVETGFDLN
ncbi:heavy-metal-associated domain-containing protein [Neobacillus sp. SM06]|uniref:heavy-metal-associated domain-containing protein n=1 Tax=Neobacillus sp. SM06 TaxID=3422492 RepID=UPI003D26F041